MLFDIFPGESWPDIYIYMHMYILIYEYVCIYIYSHPGELCWITRERVDPVKE